MLPIPTDSPSEQERLAALRALDLLDSPEEASFDRLTALAADIFDAPMALVTLVDEHRQWFKSRVGVAGTDTPRCDSFCAQALPLGRGGMMVVEDAQLDPRFKDYPAVTGEMGLRFYAGAVLTTVDGMAIGALCVLDTKPRPHPTPRELGRLRKLADNVMEVIEARQAHRREASERLLLEMAERMAGIGAWRYDLASETVWWSDAVYRIHGVEPGAFNPNFDDTIAFYHPDDQSVVREHLRWAVETGEGFQYRLRLKRPSGETRTVNCRAAVERSANGDVRALSGIFQDVTEQVLAIREVQRSEARFRLLADNMGDVITRIRLDGASNYISPAIEDLLGYRPEEMAGGKAQDFVHPDDQPQVLAIFAELARGVPSRTLEHRAVRKDGVIVWVETHFKLVRDERGRPTEMVAVIRDATLRKALEEELRAARREAEAAAQAKTEFLANMSHEIRTPLTAVIGFASLLAHRDDLPDAATRQIKRIEAASKSLMAVVNDVLDFSKLEAGQVEIHREPCRPEALLSEAVELFDAAAKAKGLALAIQGHSGEPLMLDPARLRQVLLNLIGNAVKFTDAGGVTVKVEHEHGRFRVGVIDTGPGISFEDSDRLFKKFSQVDASSTRSHGGTGLGLAICKGLIEAMGGKIGVDSKPGEGSVFWFEIPAIPADPLDAPILEADQPDLAGLRVLVVDDNPSNRYLVCNLLASLGCQCLEADNGLAALALAAKAPVDVIMMDLRMPGLDGRETAGRLKATPGPNADTPILCFSAEAPGAAGEPFAGKVDKPITASSLYAALSAAVRLPNGRTAGAA